MSNGWLLQQLGTGRVGGEGWGYDHETFLGGCSGGLNSPIRTPPAAHLLFLARATQCWIKPDGRSSSSRTVMMARCNKLC